jgi:hypothetical protein
MCTYYVEKPSVNTQGQTETESGSLKITEPNTEGGGALPYNIPKDMEVGGDSLVGVPCQYAYVKYIVQSPFVSSEYELFVI